MMVGDSDDGAAEAYERGLSATEAGDIEEAEIAFREAASAGHSDAAISLAHILIEREDLDEAAALLEKADGAGNLLATINLAHLYAWNLERPEDARRLWGKAIETDDIRALLDYGGFLWFHDDYEQAGMMFRRMADAGEPRGWLQYAYLQVDQDKTEAALHAFQRAESLGVSEAGPQIGWQLMQLGELEPARTVLRQSYSEGDLMSAYLLGQVEGALGNESAATSLEQEVRARAGEVSLEYRQLLAGHDGEGLQVEQLAGWIEEDSEDPAPLPVAALLYDSARLAELETRLRMAIKFGGKAAKEALASLLEMTGRSDVEAALDADVAQEIYVRLPDEAVEVWRPVEAQRLEGMTFRICEQPYDEAIERWEFRPGDDVECKMTTIESESVLAAVEPGHPNTGT